MKKKLKYNLIFMLMGAILFFILSPISTIASDVRAEIAFQVGDLKEQIQTRQIKLWKYDRFVQSNETEKANFLSELKSYYNKNTIDSLLGNPDEILNSDGSYVLRAGLSQGHYVGEEEVITVSGKRLRAFHSFFLSGRDMTIVSKYYQQYASGKIKLIKTDESGNKLSDVGFRLYFDTDHPLNETSELKEVPLKKEEKYLHDFSPNGLTHDLYTDSDGVIEVENLPEGNYIFREVRAKHGYTIENRDTLFKVKSNETTEKTVINKLGGGFHFRKIDSETKTPLEGAKFSLTKKVGSEFQNVKDENGQNIVLISDEEGFFSVGNLAYGNYYLWETSSPLGYELLSEPVEFEIADSTQSLLLNIENTKSYIELGPEMQITKRPLQIPKTGDITIIVMLIVGILMVGMGIYFVRTDSKENE